MYEQTDEHADKWTFRQMYKQTDEHTDSLPYIQMYKQKTMNIETD